MTLLILPIQLGHSPKQVRLNNVSYFLPLFAADNFPLHKAAYKGNTALLEQLLLGGARVNASTYDNVTPLHDACLAGNTHCAWLLIKAGALVTPISVKSTPFFPSPLRPSDYTLRVEKSEMTATRHYLTCNTPSNSPTSSAQIPLNFNHAMYLS